MKARTKARRRAKGAGRKPIPNMPRTASGAISRSHQGRQARDDYARDLTEAEKADTMSVAVEMRQRVHGATTATARRPEWGYVLGRIYLDGKLGSLDGLGKVRLEAGTRYADTLARYHGLTGIPFPSARAQNLFSVHGYDGETSAERAKAARRASDRRMELEGVLLRLSSGRAIASTVHSVCFLDIDESRGWPDHMMAFLRRGLDALILNEGLRGRGE
jgi:hypothetical protein